MSGHSKWSTIKRQKAVTDARRSAVFTKYARLITVAARTGGGDPAMNFRLRLAIDQARSVNMPNDNIERAIKAGTGADRGDQAKDMVYEGFGPGGVAVIVEAVTDNPNRTASDVRTVLSKHGGSLGGQNSVQWMFERRGVVRVPASLIPGDPEAFALGAVDAGATDFSNDEHDLTLFTTIEQLPTLRSWLEEKKVVAEQAGIELVPTTTLQLSAADEQALGSLLDDLDEHPDVTNTVTNAR